MYMKSIMKKYMALLLSVTIVAAPLAHAWEMPSPSKIKKSLKNLNLAQKAKLYGAICAMNVLGYSSAIPSIKIAQATNDTTPPAPINNRPSNSSDEPRVTPSEANVTIGCGLAIVNLGLADKFKNNKEYNGYAHAATALISYPITLKIKAYYPHFLSNLGKVIGFNSGMNFLFNTIQSL